MDRAYEGNETRQLALDLGFIPVVPPHSTRIEPWEYDRVMYKRRNEIERLFRRLKGFRRIERGHDALVEFEDDFLVHPDDALFVCGSINSLERYQREFQATTAPAVRA